MKTHSVASTDGVQLHVRSIGQGTPIVFVHEYAGDHRAWEPQVAEFSRDHLCVVYNARGYPPSTVPAAPHYSQAKAAQDLLAVLDGLNIRQAHIVGLSMGGYCTLHFGLSHPERALSLAICGAGYGSHPDTRAQFQQESFDLADRFEKFGCAEVSKTYAATPARLAFKRKNPQAWSAFAARLAEHDQYGHAYTARGVQGQRPSIYDLQSGMKAMKLPTLIVTGDEDVNCFEPSVFMHQNIRRSGLWVVPQTGHVINLEEPELFNAQLRIFFQRVLTGGWAERA
ncbi:MAG: hypothetical protein RL468_2366 [Pseudomonadota bacterium]|jgi:pimeloyl-ACP methyl ester carboxylesterase